MKRPPEQRRKLSPELEAFARSDDEKLRIRRPRVDRGQIRDPREGYTVAGVANRDARAVYDVRSVAMRALWDEGAADERALATLGQLFHDALRLELWHARRLTSFAAFAEEVVGVPAERAETLADEAALRTGEPVTPLTEVAIALWLRTEAGLYEGDEGARARVRSGDRGLVLELVVDLNDASTALAGVGARHLPLARSVPAREDSRSHGDARGAGRDHDDGGAGRGVGRAERRSHDEPRVAREAAPERHHAPVRSEARAELADEEELAIEEGVESELPLDDGLDEDEPLEPAALASELDEGDESELSEDDDAVADVLPERAPVLGGARLLTRKAPREELADDGVDAGDAADETSEHWGRRESRGERADLPVRADVPARNDEASLARGAARDDRGGSARGERPKFGGERPAFGGQDRGGSPRPERSGERPRFGGERPKFGGERPAFGGNDRAERPKFGGGNDRSERPRFGNNDRPERPKFGAGNDRGERPKFGAGNDRGERPKFGAGDDRGERPKFGAGNDRGERPRFGAGNDRGERPKFGAGNDRPKFGGNDRGERPRFDQGRGAAGAGRADGARSAGGFTQGSERERSKFGGQDRGGERPRFGGGEKPQRAGGFTLGNERQGASERPRFGGQDRGGERPRFGGGEKPQRAGGFVQGGKPTAGGDKRPAGKGFGARKEFSGSAPTGRDRDPTRPVPTRRNDGEE